MLLPIQQSMRHPEQMHMVLTVTMLIVVLLCMIFAGLCYWYVHLACLHALWMSAPDLTAVGAGRMVKTPSLSSLSTLAMVKGWAVLVR